MRACIPTPAHLLGLLIPEAKRVVYTTGDVAVVPEAPRIVYVDEIPFLVRRAPELRSILAAAGIPCALHRADPRAVRSLLGVDPKGCASLDWWIPEPGDIEVALPDVVRPRARIHVLVFSA